jgi:hypothetical protein
MHNTVCEAALLNIETSVVLADERMCELDTDTILPCITSRKHDAIL